ncbi:hypothetical protein GCM10009730_59670 [Streptomyces albidochromogenes]
MMEATIPPHKIPRPTRESRTRRKDHPQTTPPHPHISGNPPPAPRSDSGPGPGPGGRPIKEPAHAPGDDRAWPKSRTPAPDAAPGAAPAPITIPPDVTACSFTPFPCTRLPPFASFAGPSP